MTKLRVIITMGFLVAFAAGLVAGLVRNNRSDAQLRQTNGPGATQPTTRRMSFAQAMGLTAEQDATVRQWREEAFREAMRDVEERRAAIRKQRDEAILPMLTAENRQVYETIMQQYTAAMSQVDRQRPGAFDRLDEKIKGILTDAQRGEVRRDAEKACGRAQTTRD